MTNATTPRYSFRRVWEFAVFNLPNLRIQLLIYLGISLLASGLCLIPASGKIQTVIFMGVWALLPMLFYCGPLVFAIGPDMRIITRQLPVTAVEKLTFYYIYLLVVIPIEVYLLPMLAGWIYTECPGLQSEAVMALYEVKYSFMVIPTILNVLSAMFVSMICFYFVEATRNNRLLWGIVAVFAANTVIGILGGIFGAVAIVKSGFLKNILSNPESVDASNVNIDGVLDIITSVDWLTIISITVMVIIVVVTGCLTFRIIRSRNL